MTEELHHECGVAALYWLNEAYNGSRDGQASELVVNDDVTPLMSPLLLDLQNRGQLAAGISSYNPKRVQVLDTFKDVGRVSEVFRMSHPGKYKAIMEEYAGRAVIGHTRYATCGADDSRYAQPFERHHGRAWKWFTFAFNGNLSNYRELRERLLSRRDYIITLDTDTEIIMHMLAYQLRHDSPPDLAKVMSELAVDFDGAYNIVFLDAKGRMFVCRDPLGLRPLCWAVQGKLFGVASESMALSNLGFDDIHSLEPGMMGIVEEGRLRFERFAPSTRKAHCFFEWVYFSNVGSVQDDSSVYLSRSRAGKILAAKEDQNVKGDDVVVVPVPDTAKAAADSFAFALGIPCMEGLIRNRYVGRTFIQPGSSRGMTVRSKYTPQPALLKGRKVFLVDDSIVRCTTMKALVKRLKEFGKAREVHVRVACPPIIAPCFYGIDMSTLGELFAHRYIDENYAGDLTPQQEKTMAAELGVDSLRYLSVDDLSASILMPKNHLCTGCVLGKYPTDYGNRLMCAARKNDAEGKIGRTYESCNS
ncbi:MAG TPA: amidophosphoribosyltransferase [Phycisphaerae bacterium]|nr:amidophosphoribosyltransferase [Phycisphaerae bacterium]HPS53754.1 amidophosphoribosyltransferase [Phycisphaerae bacterium]